MHPSKNPSQPSLFLWSLPWHSQESNTFPHRAATMWGHLLKLLGSSQPTSSLQVVAAAYNCFWINSVFCNGSYRPLMPQKWILWSKPPLFELPRVFLFFWLAPNWWLVGSREGPNKQTLIDSVPPSRDTIDLRVWDHHLAIWDSSGYRTSRLRSDWGDWSQLPRGNWCCYKMGSERALFGTQGIHWGVPLNTSMSKTL